MKEPATNSVFEPPYYAVIFSSQRSADQQGYDSTAQHMLELAHQQPGFLGVDSVSDGRQGITVSYWKDEASIASWKQQIEHRKAQQKGQQNWYASYQIHVSRVERSYSFKANKK